MSDKIIFLNVKYNISIIVDRCIKNIINVIAIIIIRLQIISKTPLYSLNLVL